MLARLMPALTDLPDTPSSLRPHRQLLRWAAAGGVVALVYLGATLVLSGPLGLPIQLAIPVAYVTAVALHFLLQRLVVFPSAKAFALSMHRQVVRYIGLGVAQYGVTALSTGLLPEILGTSEKVVYVATVIVLSAITFAVLRFRVFHHAQENGGV